jgi:predicted methyltransferase
MKRITGLVFAGLIAAASLGLGPAVMAQPPAPQDALTDPALKGPEVIAFIGVRVADIVSGRFVRALSQAVGPRGKVYAVMPAEVIKVHPEVGGMLTSVAGMPAYSNVVVLTPPIDHADLPKGLDAVFIRQNYHDLHDKFMGPADVPAFNRAVYAALKPGGVYVVLDHAAPGTGLSVTDTLHRIDPAAVRSEVEAAGFKFDGESRILANPDDDHSKMVFNPAIRGKTDQFLFRFRKPR